MGAKSGGKAGGQAVRRSGDHVWKSTEVADALGVSGPQDQNFAAISTDTRHLTPHTLFVALKGERFDAHQFLADARAHGATAAVVRRGTPRWIACLLRSRALSRRSDSGGARRRQTGGSPWWRHRFERKTSSKEDPRRARDSLARHATSANLNISSCVPLTSGRSGDTDALVVEAGASVPGEIDRLRRIIEPTIAVVTNVGYAHVEGFGSLEGVMREKLALVEGVPLAIVGTDPPALAAEARHRTRTLVAGSDPAADVHPDHAELDNAGQPRIRWAGQVVTVPVTGFHQIENAAIAVAVAREAGADPGRALAALAHVQLPPGRGGMLTVRGLTVIDDTYNANPASLHWAVRFAHWLAARQRRPLAVGGGLECWNWGGECHIARGCGSRFAARGCPDRGVGEFVPAFADLPLEGRLVTAPDAEALGPRLREALQGDEIVLLKASRGAALERVLRHLN